MRIAGKTFVVTGGLSGLGEATAAMLATEGAKVVIADLPETDVTDEAAVRALIGPLDELHGAVNCAGIGGGARVIGFPLDRFRRTIEVNLIGTFIVLSAAAAKMAEGEPDEEGTRGVIVNTASNAAFDGQIGQAAYSASKAGVAVCPSRRTQTASGRSSHFSCGIAITAASAIEGCAIRAFSSSTDEIHSPPDLITSLERSLIIT